MSKRSYFFICGSKFGVRMLPVFEVIKPDAIHFLLFTWYVPCTLCYLVAFYGGCAYVAALKVSKHDLYTKIQQGLDVKMLRNEVDKAMKDKEESY